MTVAMPDDPAVASIPGGGPDESPELFVKSKKYIYEVVQGFFKQNGPEPKSVEFEEMLEQSFGIVDRSEDRWHNLKASVKKLQLEAPADVQYKVFFLGRHGEGWHNYAVSQIGVEPWEAKWAMEYGNGTLTWGPDPALTTLGQNQAKAINRCWLQEAPFGPPITKEEMRWFVSPFTRAAETMEYSWGELLVGEPEVWEDFREVYGSHTCDQRRSKTELAKQFPRLKFEDGFVENDELWKADERETDAHMQLRSQRALDRLFGENGVKETYISITAHSGIFRNFLAVLQHQSYPLATGEMIPVVVRATVNSANQDA